MCKIHVQPLTIQRGGLVPGQSLRTAQPEWPGLDVEGQLIVDRALLGAGVLEWGLALGACGIYHKEEAVHVLGNFPHIWLAVAWDG